MKLFDRRSFIKSFGTAGIGTALAISGGSRTGAGAASPFSKVSQVKVPTRFFGKTGLRVSMLAFGGSRDLTGRQLLLKQALKMGVTYWDTAPSYGDSEASMGKYFLKYPEDRKKVFLVTKSNSSNPEELADSLDTSLERLNTNYVDMFFIHGVSNAGNELTNAVKKWAEAEKSKGRIRFFGFSTHKNMAKCLTHAAKLGWIDGIMTSYNYRLMNSDAMKKAVEACFEAGIGLTAMKTQAAFLARIFADTGNEDGISRALVEQFQKRGFTLEQAKLKAVWENPHIASICSEMPNMTLLKSNADAAMDGTALSINEKSLLEQHAANTASYYCRGCAEYCEAETICNVPISDVIRCVMYAHEYGENERARKLLKQISPEILKKLSKGNYGAVEMTCPNKIPIAMIMKEARKLLV